MLFSPWGSWAAGSFAVYALVSLRVGELFPFSAYSMYAKTAKRTHGAVPIVIVDGATSGIAGLKAFRRFSGIQPERIYPAGIPCSLEWQVEEARRWLQSNLAPQGDDPGPRRLQIGYRLLAVDRDGRVSQSVRIVAEGRAWPA